MKFENEKKVWWKKMKKNEFLRPAGWRSSLGSLIFQTVIGSIPVDILSDQRKCSPVSLALSCREFSQVSETRVRTPNLR